MYENKYRFQGGLLSTLFEIFIAEMLQKITLTKKQKSTWHFQKRVEECETFVA